MSVLDRDSKGRVRALDLTGRSFGRLTAIERVGTRGESPLWRCACACGGERITTTMCLRRGDSVSCGCHRAPEDFVGRKFGTLTVIALVNRTSSNECRWLLRCDCGKERFTVSSKLNTRCHCRHCGPRKHGHASKGAMSPEYQTWAGMRKRCLQPNCKAWPNYGGRGIRISPRWDSFENFLADVGPKPSPAHSLDRIDVNGNYEPGNVRWATKVEQARNTRATKLEAHEAEQIRWLLCERQTKTSIARFFGISITTVSRIQSRQVWAT